MQIRSILAAAMVTIAALALFAGSSSTSGTGADNVITQLAEQGEGSSLALDATGNPVVAFSDPLFLGTDLNILHCDDPHCIGVESITSPDSGFFPSLVLDGQGYPVVSYLGDSGFLKVMHCNDANCSGADESITVVDTVGGSTLPSKPSLQIDALGFPVVTYHEGSTGALKVLHCNDSNCSGGDESITSPETCCDSADSSLSLDGSGNPVVSYRANGLKIMHCNDPNCSGGDETFASPDGALGGSGTSLALDSSGRPVVSYLGPGGWPPKLLHCGDVDCASSNSINALEPSSNDVVSGHSRLVLDAAGYPAISYTKVSFHPTDSGRSRLAHCNDPDCAGGDEAITTLPAPSSDSLALDAAGIPVLTGSVFNLLAGDSGVFLIYCGDLSCGFKAPTPPPAVGGVAHGEDLRALPAATPQSSDFSSSILIAGAALVGVAALAGMVWWARRRFYWR